MFKLGIKNKSNIENDICDLKMQLIDYGDNVINASIKVNENTYENCIKSMVFLPLMKKKKIIIAGSGQQVNVKTFVSKINLKTNNENNESKNVLMNSAIFSNEKRNCDCCNIY